MISNPRPSWVPKEVYKESECTRVVVLHWGEADKREGSNRTDPLELLVVKQERLEPIEDFTRLTPNRLDERLTRAYEFYERRAPELRAYQRGKIQVLTLKEAYGLQAA